MPVSLKALRERGATVDVEMFGEVATITYDPTKITTEFRIAYVERAGELQKEIEKARAAANEDGGPPFDPLMVKRADAEMMLMLVKSWDDEVIGLNGKTLPLEVDAVVTELPHQFINNVSNAILEDSRTLGKSMNGARTSNSKISSSG